MMEWPNILISDKEEFDASYRMSLRIVDSLKKYNPDPDECDIKGSAMSELLD